MKSRHHISPPETTRSRSCKDGKHYHMTINIYVLSNFTAREILQEFQFMFGCNV